MSWPNPWAQGGPPVAQNMMMGMGNNYTQGQWAAMQQQTWQQQWAQWEQYSQWPGQYNNDNFQQQGHVQGMAVAPPLPVGVAPPAPPPPENPPPPPPHESEQLQYNKNTTNHSNSNHTISKNSQLYPIPSNNQNYYQNENSTENSYYDNDNSNFSQTSTDSQQYQSPASIGEEMKKIEEEQKLFDIKISDWERDIEKWRAENANHPDKDTYRMYEDKFQTWIADALKRRQEMHQKWLQLSGKLSNTPNSTTSNYSKPSKGNISNNIPIKQINIQNNNSNKHNINNKSERSVNLKEVIPNSIISSKSNVNDFKKSFIEMTQPPPNTNFLPPHDSKKGIPGLDLVDKVAKPLPIEIIEDDSQMDISPNNPDDFKEISKGIQNILGDEKIMNILSLVSNQISKGDNQSVQNKQSQSFNGANWDPQQNSVSYGRQPQNLEKQHDRQLPNVNRPQQIFDKQHGDNRQQQNFNRPQQNFDRQLQNNDRRQAQNYNNQEIKNNQPQNFNNQQKDFNNQQQDFNNQQQQFNIQQKHFNNQGENYNRQSQNINRQCMQRGFNDTQPNENLRPNQHYQQPNKNFRDDSQDQMRSAAEPIRPPNDQRRPVDIIRGGNMMSSANQMQSSGEYVNRPVELKPVAPIIDQPVIDVALIVDYEHKPLRLKARNFIEPVQTFDYNHKSKDDEYKITFDEASEFSSINKDDNSGFTRRERVDDRFTRNANRSNFVEDRRRLVGRYDDRRLDDRYDDRRRPDDRFEERRWPEDRFEERRRPEDRFEERRRPEDRYDDIRRLDNRRRPDDRYEERRRPDNRYDKRIDDRHSDKRRVEDRPSEESKRREDRGDSQSHKSDISDSSRESRKRTSDLKESDEDVIKRPKAIADNRVIMIDDILESPGRDMRPDKIFVIIRGIPGSGKSYLAKLIRDRELEFNGSVKLLSIDDYFMQEVTTEEKDPLTGKMVQKINMVYEYDLNSEENYLKSLYRSAKKIISDGFYSFIILDADNESYNKFGDTANFAKQSGFQVYICNLELDVETCFKRNIHNRSYDEVCVVKARFIEYNKGCRYLVLDPTTLLQSAAITEVDMEDVTEDDYVEEQAEDEVSSSFTSKWEKMDDVAQLARLDGISKPPRASLSMEDYLQVEDWQPKNTKPGKKSVRWADIEERREQEKMRAIGFVVGQTDWQRMTDPTLGSSALTKTKYIERVRRN